MYQLNEIQIVKRDHRKIAKELDLYHLQDEAPGMVFWHPNGFIIFREILDFIRIKLKEYHYKEVKSPFLIDKILWKKTGHLDHYSNSIFITSSENRHYCVKPMNCPAHIQIFNHGIKSYRDLPLRLAEFGNCHRNEPSGSLYGLMRVRSFTQDDAHIFCTREQLVEEISKCIDMIYDIYKIFGFNNVDIMLSTRPNKRIGDDKIWNEAEYDLINILNNKKIKFKYQVGDGAFYGPKIEFILYDSLNRAWQCGTIQLDFLQANSLGAYYIDNKNNRIAPIMIHRAVLGSIERFIGILTEEYFGNYPIWLAPIQVVVIALSEKHHNYVKKVVNKIELSISNIRINYDLRKEKINFKIREYTILRIPYMIICGDKEIEEEKISVRARNGKNLGLMNINDIIKKLKQEIINRSIY